MIPSGRSSRYPSSKAFTAPTSSDAGMGSQVNSSFSHAASMTAWSSEGAPDSIRRAWADALAPVGSSCMNSMASTFASTNRRTTSGWAAM
jgi:hypothetical protein